MNFKHYWNTLLLENNNQIWFHGDISKRENFCDQKMDRDPFIKDPNANGPGIYFTNNYNEAKGYAAPNGFIYKVNINSNNKKIITDKDKSSYNKKFLFNLIKKAQSIDPESVWYALTDYGLEIQNHQLVADYHIMSVINKNLNMLSLIDSCIVIYKEFFRRNANIWAKSMSDLGVIGYHHKTNSETIHFVVYDCNAINIIEEEKYI